MQRPIAITTRTGWSGFAKCVWAEHAILIRCLLVFWFLKLQALANPTGCKNLQNLAPLFFKVKRYSDSSSLMWKSISLPSLSMSPLFPQTALNPFSSSLHSFSLLTLLDVASFLHLVVEFFCWTSGHFLGCLHWCECYLVGSVGHAELRVLLLWHVPSLLTAIKLPSKYFHLSANRKKKLTIYELN